MLSSDEALAMRAMIADAGLDFRSVYQTVGIERETDTTWDQLIAIERIIQQRGGSREPVRAEAISAAAVGGDVEILVIARNLDGTVVRALYEIGPVAAKSLILLLRDAVNEL